MNIKHIKTYQCLIMYLMIIKRIMPYNIHYSQKRYILMFIGKEKTIPTNLRKHLTLGHYLNVKQRVSRNISMY